MTVRNSAALAAIYLLIFASCTTELVDNATPTSQSKSSDKKIIEFKFLVTSNTVLFSDVVAQIDEAKKSINASVPFGTDISMLTPKFTTSEGSSADKSGGQDFSKPVPYTITAEDGSSITYQVMVTIAEITEREVLMAIHKANPDNTLDWDFKAPYGTWYGVTRENGKVVKLILRSEKIAVLPKEIGLLKDLAELDVSITPLTKTLQIPTEFTNLTKLRKLTLQDNNLVSIPAEIFHLKTLEFLDLSNNRIKTIPGEIAELDHLKILYLHFNNITQISAALGNLKSLNTLLLVANDLQTIPQQVCNLTGSGTDIKMDEGVTCQ